MTIHRDSRRNSTEKVSSRDRNHILKMNKDKAQKIILPELPGNLKNLAGEEDKIKLQSLTLIKSDAILDKRLTAYENAMNTVRSLTIEHKDRTDDELTIQYIGIRLFNDLAVSLRLMFSGYYKMSFAIQRDMIEVAFLLDCFLLFSAIFCCFSLCHSFFTKIIC